MRRRIRDRLFVGAHSEGSTYWLIAAVGLVWATVAVVLGNWDAALEGVLGAITMVLVIWVVSRALAWPFWPWK